MNNEQLFDKLLEMALSHAEIKHNFPGKALGAYMRIVKIRRGGQTGFVNVPDPERIVSEFAAEIYDGVKMDATNSIFLAERG